MNTTSENNQPSKAARGATLAQRLEVSTEAVMYAAGIVFVGEDADSNRWVVGAFGLDETCDTGDEAADIATVVMKSVTKHLDAFAAPHIAEATARRQEAAAAELDAATLRGENAQLRRQLEAAEKMAKSIRMTKGEVDYDPCYEDGLGNTYTAYAMDTDYYHNMMGALREWDEVTVPPLAAPIPDSIIETHKEGQG